MERLVSMEGWGRVVRCLVGFGVYWTNMTYRTYLFSPLFHPRYAEAGHTKRQIHVSQY